MSKEFNYSKLSNSEIYYCIEVLGAVICADTHITAVHMLRLLQKEKDRRAVRDAVRCNTKYKLEEPSDLVAHFD